MMKKQVSDDPIERFLTEGTLKAAVDVIPMGRAAITPLLRQVLRAERSRSWWYEGRSAAALLSFLPLDNRVIDVMWRLEWDYDVEMIFQNSPLWYCGLAGPRVITSPLQMLNDDDVNDIEHLGVAELLKSIGYNYPELRPDIAKAFEEVLETTSDNELGELVAFCCMELGLSDLASRFVQRHSDGVQNPDWFGGETYSQWLAEGGHPDDDISQVYVPIFEKAFPKRKERRRRITADEDTRVQEAVEICAREKPECLLVADAFAAFRMGYNQQARVLKPNLVENFLLEHWPEFVVAGEEEQSNLLENLDQFIQVLVRLLGMSKAHLSRRIRECRVGFRHLCRDHRQFSRSKRIVIAAQEAKIDWTNRGTVIDWWFNEGHKEEGGDWPSWVLAGDWRLADVYLPTDIPAQEFGKTTD